MWNTGAKTGSDPSWDETGLHAYLRAGAGYRRLRVGPFLATFTPGTDHPMRNYAVPDDGAEPNPAEVADLVDAFAGRGLQPRLEYAPGAAPALEAALLAAGFRAEARVPVFTCRPGERHPVPPPPDIEVGSAVTDADHRDAMVVAAAAYDNEVVSPGANQVRARRAMVAAGGRVTIARLVGSGEVVGSGLYPVPRVGVTEVAAVATGPGFTGRGVASAVTSHLAGAAHDQGIGLVWLTIEHVAERRAALAAGFRDTGEQMLHISLP